MDFIENVREIQPKILKMHPAAKFIFQKNKALL